MTPRNSEERSGPKRVQTARPSAPKGGRRVSRLPSYRNRQRFPESNNSYRQLRLLLAALRAVSSSFSSTTALRKVRWVE